LNGNHNPRNLLGGRGFEQLYECEKSPPDHSGVNDFCRNGHHDLAAGKISPEQASKAMLTALNNQVSLSADQQDKAKPIIDKHVADLEAVKNDTTLDKDAKKAKVVELRQQYVTDINGILTPDQQKKWEASREANKAKVKAHVKKKAAEQAPQ
jgi:hypothetical protein